MAEVSGKRSLSSPDFLPFGEDHYRELKRRHIFRLFITYIGPLLILVIYSFIQYASILQESERVHLKAIAENQSNTLNLFMLERIVNLDNLIDDPKFVIPPGPQMMQSYLDKLEKNSSAFIDVGFFDSTGIQTAYAGPYSSLENRNYSSEEWFNKLKEREKEYIITDIYLGFRQQPHFTIAVKRIIEGKLVILRATLGPEQVYEYMLSLEGAAEVYTSIVNDEGFYQLVTPHMGTPLESSSIVPPKEPRLGFEKVKVEGTSVKYAYSWLATADWALIVQKAKLKGEGLFSNLFMRMILLSLAIVILSVFILLNRANKLIALQKETDHTRAQLEHAAKLASVGELAAGIAHEINNPLAVINEEAGLMKDLMNPEFGEPPGNETLITHLDTIEESVFRCRDITHKLLGFVRKTEMEMRPHDINELIDGVAKGLLGNEMAVSNIEIERNFNMNLPKITTDGNQLQQVLLNIINNGVDAIEEPPGKITIETRQESNNIVIKITDTGKGMTPAQLEKIFLPFYTTKEVGKGTGLGLSVSYGIIKNLGGKIEVESAPGHGSTFSIFLPISWDKSTKKE